MPMPKTQDIEPTLDQHTVVAEHRLPKEVFDIWGRVLTRQGMDDRNHGGIARLLSEGLYPPQGPFRAVGDPYPSTCSNPSMKTSSRSSLNTPDSNRTPNGCLRMVV